MNLNDSLINYLKNPSWKKSLFINGSWGTGKTYFLKNFFKVLDKNIINSHTHYCFVNGYEINEDFDIKKHIAHNSFELGTEKLDPLVNNIISNILLNTNKYKEKLPKYIQNTIEQLGSGVKKSTVILENTKFLGLEINIESVLSNFYNNNLKYIYESGKLKECIVVIDELDRNTKIDIKTIFSKIIDLMENYNVKVILVSNLMNTNTLNDFNEWFEKIVDFQFDFKNESVIDTTYMSKEFEIHFKNNILWFSNRRSYQKYLNFEKIINDEFSGFFNRLKEAIFYSIFFKDNLYIYNKENKLKSSATFIDVYNSYNNIQKNDIFSLTMNDFEIVQDFISLNYKNLFERINEIFSNSDFDLKCSLIQQINIYKTSKNLSHPKNIKDNHNLIYDNVVPFITNLINKHRKILSLIDNENPYFSISSWLNELRIYNKNHYENEELIETFKLLLDMYHTKIMKEKIENCITYIESESDTFIEKFKKEYDCYPKIIEKAIYKINYLKEDLDKKIKIDLMNNFVLINKPTEFLNYYIKNVPCFFVTILENSQDYYSDLTVIIKNYPDWYVNELNDYISNYSDKKLKQPMINELNLILETYKK